MCTWFRRRGLGELVSVHVLFVGMCIVTTSTSGCASSDASSMSGKNGNASTIDPATPVIPREDVSALGYRTEWQSISGSGRVNGLKFAQLTGGALFLLDERNVLSRLRSDDGSRIWSTPVSSPVEDIQGITYVPSEERVYLPAGGQMFVVDSMNGVPLPPQRLEKLISTEPVLFGNDILYGSIDGQLIWHAYGVAYSERAYQVARSIHVRPTLHNGIVAVAGVLGELMVIDAATASQRWSKKLLDPAVVPPAMDERAVYVACSDQHLYAFDLGSGRRIWSRLFEKPLVDAPAVFGDDLYQYVPGIGLMCFDAVPSNKPNGVDKWTCEDAAGTVIAIRRDHLLVWDADTQVLTSVDRRTGALRHAAQLDGVVDIERTSRVDPTLFLVSVDGRIQRLVPQP